MNAGTVARQVLLGTCLGAGVVDLVWLNRTVFPALLHARVAVRPAPPAMVRLAPVVVQLPDAPAPPSAVTLRYGISSTRVVNARDRLAALAAALVADASLVAVVEGHADQRGTAEENLALSRRRARLVAETLMAAGVPATRVRVRAFGATRPAVAGDGASAMRANRRVEVRVEGGGRDS